MPLSTAISTADKARHDLFIFTNWPVFIWTQLGKIFAKACVFEKAALEMTIEFDQKTLASIDCVIAFKRGEISLDEALDQFCFVTGISRKIARKALRQLKRDNVIRFANSNKGPK